MRSISFSLIAAAAAAVSAVPAHAQNIVTGGDFENPVIAGSFQQFPAGSPLGWTVDSGTVDLVRAPYVVYEGSQALDLFGTSVGSISQVLTTVAGQVYNLTFAYSHNSASSPSNIYTGTVNLGSISQTISHTGDPTVWTLFSGTFTGTGSDTLSFLSGPGFSNGGIFLDAVSVAAVPEPAAWAMLIMGFGLVGGAMRYRKRATKVSFAAA